HTRCTCGWAVRRILLDCEPQLPMHTDTTRSFALHLCWASSTRESPSKLMDGMRSRPRCRPGRSQEISERIRFFGSTKTTFELHSRSEEHTSELQSRGH